MSYLTKLPGIPDSGDVKPGMAYYPGTGPAGKTCSDCRWRGYFRRAKDKVNPKTMLIEEKYKKTLGCREFLRLSQRHGPAVEGDWPACKYFEEAPK